MIHDKQRQSLIAHNKAKINAITSQFLREKLPGVKAHLNNELESAITALASLEAEPLGWCLLGLAPAFTADKSKADFWIYKGWDVRPVYTVPPVLNCVNQIEAHEESEELKSRCEALAAENASLLIAINQTIGWQESVDAENVESVRALRELQTPATDAVLNTVRAEGVEILTGKLQQLIDEGNFEGDEIGLIAGAVYTGADIADKLRETGGETAE